MYIWIVYTQKASKIRFNNSFSPLFSNIKENIYLSYSLIYKVLDTLTYGIYREDYDDLQKYKKDLQKSTKNNSDSLTGHISLNI